MTALELESKHQNIGEEFQLYVDVDESIRKLSDSIKELKRKKNDKTQGQG